MALGDIYPFGHVCTPGEVANVVRWIVSERASYITGQRIYVDAGGPSVGAY